MPRAETITHTQTGDNFMTETVDFCAHPPRKRRHSTRSYRRRLKVAGLHDDTMPDDIDEFRNQLARRICMFINEWHGCPELLCARNRGCMAPNGNCANCPPPTAEEMERDWPQVRAEIYNAVKAVIAEAGVVD
jgi:hypothetical protein